MFIFCKIENKHNESLMNKQFKHLHEEDIYVHYATLPQQQNKTSTQQQHRLSYDQEIPFNSKYLHKQSTVTQEATGKENDFGIDKNEAES